MKRFLSVLMLLSVGVVLFAFGSSETYPTKSITIIVPSKAGGSTDATARKFAQVAKKYWKQANFVVENIGGSGGLKGFDKIASADPDGYTLGMVFTPQLVAHVVSGLAHYNLDSFHIVGNFVEDPGIVVVPADSDINNLDDLKEAAMNKRIVVAVNGIGSDDYIVAKDFEKIAGVSFDLFPTAGSTEQKSAILGNHLDASFMNLSQMLAQFRAGKAKIIAITTKERSPIEESIPTAQQQGYNVYMVATRGMVTQAAVDQAILKALDGLVGKVLNDSDFKDAMKKQLIAVAPMDGKMYKDYLMNLQIQTQRVYDENPW